MGKNAGPRPGYIPRTLSLTIRERGEGYEIVICPLCEAGARRKLAGCSGCGGRGEIKCLNPEKSFDREEVGLPKRGGRPVGSKDKQPRQKKGAA